MKFILAALLLAWSATTEAEVDENVLKQLAPTGTLKAGIAYAPTPTPVFAAKDAGGGIRGVPKDLAAALAKSLGVPVEYVVKATTGELTDALSTGAIDIGFMPADDERRKRVDFSPPYFMIESTYLALGSTDIKTLAEVDRADITVVGINGSTTMRAAGRTLKNAKVIGAKSVDEAMEILKAGGAQAFALTHDSLPALQKQLPGSRILDGAFQKVDVSVAVQKDKPAALAYVKDFIISAKTNGIVQKAFDDAGLKGLAIPP